MYYIAQANYSQWKPDVSQNLMKDFLSQVEAVHSAAEISKGYVWHYDYDPHSKMLDELFGIERIIFNMTVWETIEDLKDFAFKNLHSEVMKRRAEWFNQQPGNTTVLWWIEQQNRPTAQEAKNKFDMLDELGPTRNSFNFSTLFDPI